MPQGELIELLLMSSREHEEEYNVICEGRETPTLDNTPTCGWSVLFGVGFPRAFRQVTDVI